MDKDKRIHELECQLDVCREVVAAAQNWYNLNIHTFDDMMDDEQELVVAMENYFKYIG